MDNDIDVEHLVQTHKLAEDRRRRGLSPWKGTLTFLPKLQAVFERLNEGDDTLTAKDILDAIQAAAQEVRTKVPQAQGPILDSEHEDLDYFLGVFEDFTLARVEACPCLEDELDPALARLYDWADINRWWITQIEADS